MIGRLRRDPLLAATILAVALWLMPPPPAILGADGACPGSTGVTVVVDFQALGGGIVTRCAPGAPASGFKALTGAGFSIEEIRYEPFLCRIDGKPTPATESCVSTPPASAFWSYWTAPRGGRWAMTNEGGGTRKPPVGSVEGWSFSDDGLPGTAAPPPGMAPPAISKPPTPKPATPKPATPPPATARPASYSPVAPGASTDALPSGDPTSSGVASVEPSTSAGEEEAPTPPMASPDDFADIVTDPSATAEAAEADTAAASTSNPPPGTLLGIGLVFVIGGAALFVTRRRPSGDADG